jgi:peptidoglycan/xylan/chitin deacetylase (PgdA/CDA1 family)
MAARTRLKRHIGRFWAFARRLAAADQRSRTCVLLYHSLGEDQYSLPVDVFERQMRFLAENVNVIPLATLLCGNITPAQTNCAITWDDGYGSIHEHALPVLKRYKLPATVYLTTGMIAEREALLSDCDNGLFPGLPMLTWEEVRDLQDNSFEVGAHLEHHLDLTALTREHALRELRSSKATVEHYTRRPCLDFAYPWGLANSRCAPWVREAGFRSASTTLHTPVPANFDPMFLPRLTIAQSYDADDFKALLRGDWDYLGILHRARQRFGLARPALIAGDN